MGVDVNLYAVGKVTDEELAAAEEFVAQRCPKDSWNPTILVRSKWEPDRIEFNSTHRYYGECYERGPWPQIYGDIVTLHAALPNCSVHYGGDSDDDCPEVDGDFLAEIWAHYLGPNGQNYHQRRTSPSCNCYPSGFTPDTYEGPQEHCPVHGAPATQ